MYCLKDFELEVPIIMFVPFSAHAPISVLPFIFRTQTDISANDCFSKYTGPRGYKTFFVLNSDEHEILTAHKY